jgi:hypothetical protein
VRCGGLRCVIELYSPVLPSCHDDISSFGPKNTPKKHVFCILRAPHLMVWSRLDEGEPLAKKLTRGARCSLASNA